MEKTKNQILSKLRADGHITDKEYKLLKDNPTNKLTIRCTENQKQALISLIKPSTDTCPFADSDTPSCHADIDCWTCFEQNVKWEITGDS